MPEWSEEELREAIARCAEEPIHRPDAIQPFGLLVACRDDPSRTVLAVSANLAEAFDRALSEVLDQPLSALVGESGRAQVDELLAAATQPEVQCTASYRGAPLATGRASSLSAHRAGGLVLVEWEYLPDADPSPERVAFTVRDALADVRAAPDVSTVAGIAARAVRAVTGFGRVLVYEFAPDWHGHVIAEARDESMASFDGVWFPAEDIPPQARELYRRSLLRQIPDARFEPVELARSAALGGVVVDMSHARLRSVSPVHLQYLHNMQVQSSLSISVLVEGALWGLIACHHPRPLHVPPGARTAIETFVQGVALRLSTLQAQALHSYAQETLRFGLEIRAALAADSDLLRVIEQRAEALREVVGAAGLFVQIGGHEVREGVVPRQALAPILAWVRQMSDGAPVATNLLGAEIDPAPEGWEAAAGVLAHPLDEGGEDWIVWVRPERRQRRSEVEKARARRDTAGTLRLSPRASFALYETTVAGSSRPWEATELLTATQVAGTLTAALAFRRLRRSKEDLTAFVAAVSHDLRAPLRTVHSFASLLETGPDELGSGGRLYLDHILTASRSMDRVIDDLLRLARVEGETVRSCATDAGAALDDALAQLRGKISSLRAVIVRPSRMPRLAIGHGALVRLFQNVIDNALKYRRERRRPRIVVEVEEQQLHCRIAVRDNGRGFPAHKAPEIFQPFRRLHADPEGTGLGLALCQRLVERAGGSIEAESEPDVGTAIFVRLPLTLGS